ncbi:MAG: glycoside hydrolase family 3 N-terminal domain-containing protein [Ilumatobacteraceae bacterium]
MTAYSSLVLRSLPTFHYDGERFRDLDGDGVLAPYEDWRLDPITRARDLLGRMTTAEKVGTLLHGTARASGSSMGVIGRGTHYDLDSARDQVYLRFVTSMITRLALAPRDLATQNNELQRVAASGRLGIPMTISSDPRHHEHAVVGAATSATGLSVWPGPLGLGAIGDVDLVREFGDVVRRLPGRRHPHGAVAPSGSGDCRRWPRIDGTFGEDPRTVRRLVGAYVEGVQGGRRCRPGLGRSGRQTLGGLRRRVTGSTDTTSTAATLGLPIRRTERPRRSLPRRPGLRGGRGDADLQHLGGLELDGEPVEAVAAGFNRQLVDGLLRRTHGFDGLVVSDWAITRDANESCLTGSPPQTPQDIAMPWGVEDLTRTERFAKAIDAGVDQLGGEEDPRPLLEALDRGLVSEARLDEAVSRVLVQKFRLGLFEHPLVDPDAAEEAVGGEADARAAAAARRRSIVALDLRRTPLMSAEDVVLADGDDARALSDRGLTITDDPEQATVALVRFETPHRLLHPTFFFGNFQHEGDLDPDPADPAWRALDVRLDAVPTIVIVHLDRPAVLGSIVGRAAAIFGEFGVDADAIADVLTGAAPPAGRLPFRLPASMADVLRQPCDRPDDTIAPLFPLGYGAPPN